MTAVTVSTSVDLLLHRTCEKSCSFTVWNKNRLGDPKFEDGLAHGDIGTFVPLLTRTRGARDWNSSGWVTDT